MYHFIGIKGSGMSSLAVIMKKLGFDVQGSDYEKHYFTEVLLNKNNIKVLPFDKNNIKKNLIIVKGNTFNEENVEVSEALRLNLKIYTYQEMVDIITRNYDLIAVSGCHGKTTTSKLLSYTLDSNYLVGDGSGDVCNSEYFVLEACEYKRHFLNYHPKITIITNIDLDHIDYFKNIDDVILAYQEFVNKSQIVIACGDNDYVRKIKGINYFYGIGKNNDFIADNIIYSDKGTTFDFKANDEVIKHIEVPFYGKHMVLNTLAVLSTCYLEGYDLNKIDYKLKTFKGANRRFTEYKVLDNVVIDDYAHHPNEIKSTIEAVRQKYPDKKLISVFEPHTYSRVKQFYKEMADSLNISDYCYIMDIYKSREKYEDYKGISSDLILKYIKNGKHFKEFDIDKLLDYRNSVLLFMSPNDLTNLENMYIEKYKEKYKNE